MILVLPHLSVRLDLVGCNKASFPTSRDDFVLAARPYLSSVPRVRREALDSRCHFRRARAQCLVRTPISPVTPICRPLYLAPCACDASSTTHRPATNPTVASIRRHLCYPRTHALWQTSRPSCVAWCTMHVACRMLYFACWADQTSRTRQLDDRVDVARAASDVHGKDSLGLRRDHLCVRRQTELELCCTRQAPAKCDQEVPSQLSPP